MLNGSFYQKWMSCLVQCPWDFVILGISVRMILSTRFLCFDKGEDMGQWHLFFLYPRLEACAGILYRLVVAWWWRRRGELWAGGGGFFYIFWNIFCRVSGLALGNVFAEFSTKNTRQRKLCRVCVCRVPFAECNTRQRLCRVFFCLRCVPWTHGKHVHSGSGSADCTV